MGMLLVDVGCVCVIRFAGRKLCSFAFRGLFRGFVRVEVFGLFFDGLQIVRFTCRGYAYFGGIVVGCWTINGDLCWV